jgi:hypothetical protein
VTVEPRKLARYAVGIESLKGKKMQQPFPILTRGALSATALAMQARAIAAL